MINQIMYITYHKTEIDNVRMDVLFAVNLLFYPPPPQILLCLFFHCMCCSCLNRALLVTHIISGLLNPLFTLTQWPEFTTVVYTIRFSTTVANSGHYVWDVSY